MFWFPVTPREVDVFQCGVWGRVQGPLRCGAGLRAGWTREWTRRGHPATSLGLCHCGCDRSSPGSPGPRAELGGAVFPPLPHTHPRELFWGACSQGAAGGRATAPWPGFVSPETEQG